MAGSAPLIILQMNEGAARRGRCRKRSGGYPSNIRVLGFHRLKELKLTAMGRPKPVGSLPRAENLSFLNSRQLALSRGSNEGQPLS